MKKKWDRDKLTDKFRTLLKYTSVIATDIRDREYVSMHASYGSNNAVLGWAKQPYLETIDAVHELCPNVSKKTIGRELQESMIRLFEEHAVSENADPKEEAHVESVLNLLDRDIIKAELDNLLDLLRKKTNIHTAFVPLTGLILKTSSLPVGDVIIYPNGSGPLLDMLEANRLLPESEKDEFLKGRGCYAVVSDLEGDTNYVHEEAPNRVLPVIDILNLYLASCSDKHKGYTKISLGKHSHDSLEVYTTSGSCRSFSGTWLTFRKYEVDSDSVGQWKSLDFDEIIRCCLENDTKPRTIESRIKRAVAWYRKAVHAHGNEEQFIALAIALESLLVGNEGEGTDASWGSITQRLADRVAFLLCNNFEDRRACSKLTKDLYGLRSKIVHTGMVVSSKNLDLMNDLVRATIFAFVHKRFSSWEDFLNWVNKQLYSTPDDKATH